MGTATLKQQEDTPGEFEEGISPDLTGDPRWQLVERIIESEPFQKSSRLPALLRYLARCTITGHRNGLTEQMIGRAVFQKPQSYTPAEDSSVRVYVRQLRLRLHEYYQAPDRHESLLVSVPKGGYTLTFSQLSPSVPAPADPAPAVMPGPAIEPSFRIYKYASLLLLLVASVCAVGWYKSAAAARGRPPWPLDQLIGENLQTTLVLADASYSLRLLGDQPVPLDRYIDHTFYEPLLPKRMSDGEQRLLHYLEVSRITSLADAHAAAALSALSSPFAANLVIRSAKTLSPNDLTRGNFIFVGAKSSNPWVELFDDRLNFQFVEDRSGERYILNRKPENGERSKYAVTGNTGTSGEDYATIALLPAKNGNGNLLLIQGLRMEGTDAAIDLLRNNSLRTKLQQKLTSANGGRLPPFFEILLHAQSVAGAPVSVDLISARPMS